jgi:hypothetical protein
MKSTAVLIPPVLIEGANFFGSLTVSKGHSMPEALLAEATWVDCDEAPVPYGRLVVR